jgi:hypothetical protein
MAERKPEGYLEGRPFHPESLMIADLAQALDAV